MAISAQRLEDARLAIEHAFSRLSVPKEADFVYSGYLPTAHQAVMRSMRERVTKDPTPSAYETGNGLYAFLGMRWQDIDEALILEAWFELFYWLKPRAFRYYLPAYLRAALKRAAVDESVLSMPCLKLGPDHEEIYFHEFDPLLRMRQRLFSSAQYRAVCGFLGLALESKNSSQDAAYALCLGWNGIDTPALAAATELRSSLRNYITPAHPDPEADALWRQIEAAFEHTPHPGDDQITAEAGFTDFEFALIAVELRGLTWQNVHPELTERLHMALSFFTDAAFRYFLPAFLRTDIYGYYPIADPVFHLAREFVGEAFSDTDQRNYYSAQFASFTLPERKAIAAYLQYRAKDDEEFNRDTILAALDTYWLPSIGRTSAA
jgi:hypothetical protein